MFTALGYLRNRALPDLQALRRAWEGRAPHPIAESTSPIILSPAAEFGLRGQNYYALARNPPYWHVIPGSIDALLLRPQVGAMLAGIDARLAQDGVRLFLHDAWRPRAVQAYFHDHWFPAELQRTRPELTGEALAKEVRRYFAPPSTAEAPAPHATGGAVDVSLIWEDGQPLFMGSLFDDGSALSHLDRFEGQQEAEAAFSHAEARANRRLLYWVMTEAGFCPHPEEWWHYSYGDSAWARVYGAPAALFGAAIED